MGDPELQAYTHKVLITVGVAVAAFAGVMLVWKAAGILFLLFAAVLLASLLRGLADQLARRSPLSPPLAVGVVVAVFLAAGVGGGWLLGPRVADQVQTLGNRLPAAVDSLRSGMSEGALGRWLLRQLPVFPGEGAVAEAGSPAEAGSDEAPRSEGAGDSGLGRLAGFFSSVFGALGNLAFIVFAGLYFAVSPGVYRDGLVRLFPPARRDRVRSVLSRTETQLRWWLVGRFSSMAVVAVLTTLGLLLIGLPLAVTLGLLAGVLSFIPVVGPILSAVPALIIAGVGGPAMVLWTLGVYGAVQTLESYLITPLIQQRAVSLPPVLILLAQLFFGFAVGFVGVALATPVAVAGVVLVRSFYVEDVLEGGGGAEGPQT